MPRNGSSVYSLPAGNPVVPGTIIATTWANTTLTDIATALTNSLSTDGSTASVSLAGKTMAGGTFNGPTVTGILTLTGGQIAFPAVQVPSANVNTLDDYEEGTFTPVLTFATPGTLTVAYSVQQGAYTKIGDLVNIFINIATTTFNLGTASGTMQVTGLPFTNSAVVCGFGGTFGGIAQDPAFGAGTNQLSGHLQAASSSILFVSSNGTTGASSNIATGAGAGGGTQKLFRLNFSYKV